MSVLVTLLPFKKPSPFVTCTSSNWELHILYAIAGSCLCLRTDCFFFFYYTRSTYRCKYFKATFNMISWQSRKKEKKTDSTWKSCLKYCNIAVFHASVIFRTWFQDAVSRKQMRYTVSKLGNGLWIQHQCQRL